MVEVDTVLVYHDVALHHHFLETTDKSLTKILQIVIADDQVYLAIQTVEYMCPFCCPPKAEVTKMEYVIVHTDNFIPICYHRFVHLLNAFEGAIAEPQYIGMVEVGVGGEEHLAAVKIMVYNLVCHNSCNHSIAST